MTEQLRVGDEAPNFDLASTEDVVLMLSDEVPRTPVLLFFFDQVEAANDDLEVLREMTRELLERGVKVMGASAATLEELKTVQRALGLAFPLLHDDRKLSAAYGLETGGESGDNTSILVLVGRDQKVLWMDRAAVAAEPIRSAVSAQKVSSTVNYPRKVINRLVDLWVN